MPGAATRWLDKQLCGNWWEKMGQVWPPFVRWNARHFDGLRNQLSRDLLAFSAPVVDVLLRSPDRDSECSLASREGLGLNGTLEGCLAHG
jgi:hypothetical protein